jgi:chorismate mutase
MNKLEKLRKQIDQLDKELVSILEKRFSIVKLIGEYKKEVGLPILDQKREQEVLDAKKKLVDDAMWPHYKKIFQLIMDFSKEVES